MISKEQLDSYYTARTPKERNLINWLGKLGLSLEDIREHEEWGRYVIIEKDEGVNGFTCGRINLPDEFQK